MLAIARALLLNPKLLIMDEPSEGLAPAVVESLIETIRSLADEGTALLVVEQKLGVATALAERQLVMVGAGSPPRPRRTSWRTTPTPSVATWASSHSPRRSENGSGRRRGKPVQSFDWGVIKWFVTPDDTDGANLTFGEVVLLPGKGHDRHNHPESEEILYVLAGEGEQMLDDGGENTFPIAAGDTIYVPTAMFHSTVNTGWQPLRLALYNPGGAEKALRDCPTSARATGPTGRCTHREPHRPADRDPRHQGGRVRVPARPAARAPASTSCSSTPARSTRRRSSRHQPRGGGGRRRGRPGRRWRGRRPRRGGDRDGPGAPPSLARLHEEGRIDGVLAAGGSGDTSIATAAMQALPVGVPKLMVSTDGRGRHARLRRRAATSTMMYSVVDVAGRQPDLARGCWPTPRPRDGRDGAAPSRRRPGGRRPAAGRGDDVRRDHPVRRPAARERSRRPATRCSSSTPRASAARRWRAWSSRGSSPACST